VASSPYAFPRLKFLKAFLTHAVQPPKVFSRAKRVLLFLFPFFSLQKCSEVSPLSFDLTSCVLLPGNSEKSRGVPLVFSQTPPPKKSTENKVILREMLPLGIVPFQPRI